MSKAKYQRPAKTSPKSPSPSQEDEQNKDIAPKSHEKEQLVASAAAEVDNPESQFKIKFHLKDQLIDGVIKKVHLNDWLTIGRRLREPDGNSAERPKAGENAQDLFKDKGDQFDGIKSRLDRGSLRS